MNALVAPAPTPSAIGPLLRTLVLCDLVNSTALVERLGDQHAAALLRRHDRLARDLVLRHGGQEIDKTDGFLVMFERPIQGVAFALEYQRQLRQLGKDEKLDLRARVGLHVGDVMVWENNSDDVAHGAKRVEVEGLVKPVAARLAGLALPGQILASGVAASLAQRAHEELGDNATTARWLNHGRYRFKGVPEPLAVYEIGEAGVAPMSAPPWSSKAHREVPWWRRPATVALEASLLLGALAASIWWVLRPPPAIAFAERDWVVVGTLKNLTTEPRFDDALQTAFRIGLEQSRYVNVLPDLQVRDTLKRMERDPGVAVDRDIGAEIAQREGARALLIPTVAEIGGKVRFTAEVIDPKSHATVYSDSSDGDGVESALPSVDRVVGEMRERLGEALATVSADSKPLDKVATKDLDALRAYSLGVRAEDVGKVKEGEALFRQALSADPDFALAHIALARMLLSNDDDKAAQEEFNKAAALKARLSNREALYVDAWQASLGPPRLALEKWKILTNLYPDFFPGEGSYSFAVWLATNRFAEAIEAGEKAASLRNPHRGNAQYLLGILYLGIEDYKRSMKAFADAEALGLQYQNSYYAGSYAAQRDFGKANELLARGKLSGVPASDIDANVIRIGLAIDQGNWADARKRIDGARQEAASVGARARRKFDGVAMALSGVTEAAADLAGIKKFLKDETALAPTASGSDRVETQFHLLLGAYLAAHWGDAPAARAALAAAGDEAQNGDYPFLGDMLAVVQSELARTTGDVQTAQRLIDARINGGELCIAHVVRMDVYASAGNLVSALKEARWLAEKRGRAYAEYNIQRMLTVFNIAQSNVALLRAAEFQAALGDERGAKSSLAEFRRVWQEAPPAASIKKTADELEAKLPKI